MLRRVLFFVVLSLGGAAFLVGCPTSEDDGALCNDSKCGPGVCLQFCGADAAKDTATPNDATKDATDASDGSVDATDDGTADASDADDAGG